jgi:hypothetical protein
VSQVKGKVTGVSNYNLAELSYALWLSAEAQYKQTSTIATQLEQIMAAVQLDDSVLTTAVTDIEALAKSSNDLASAVTTFLTGLNTQNIPAAQLDALNTALADADTARTNAANSVTALQNAGGGAAPNSATS